LVVDQVESILSGKAINEETIAEAASAAMAACNPIDDVRGSARYRKMMVKNLSFKAITAVWDELRK